MTLTGRCLWALNLIRPDRATVEAVAERISTATGAAVDHGEVEESLDRLASDGVIRRRRRTVDHNRTVVVFWVDRGEPATAA